MSDNNQQYPQQPQQGQNPPQYQPQQQQPYQNPQQYPPQYPQQPYQQPYQQQYPQYHQHFYQQVAPQPVERESNGFGNAGLTLAIIGAAILWIPLFGWIAGSICWLLGFIFSMIGVFRSPRGKAIAGLIICGAAVIVYMLILDEIVGSSYYW